VRAPDFGSRVLLAALLPAAGIAIALAWYFMHARLEDLEQELHNRGIAMARQLAPAMEFGVFSGNRELLRKLTTAAMREADVVGLSVLDAKGTALVTRGKLVEAPRKDASPLKGGIVSAAGDVVVYGAPVGPLQALSDDLFAENLPDVPAAHASIGTVLVALSRASTDRRKRELVLSASTITALLLLVTGLVARTLARDVTAPVLRLAKVVSDIKRGNLGARASGDSPGVLKLLEAGINEMAAALAESRGEMENRISAATAQLQEEKDRAEQANRAKTQFLAAASHDLRQPLQAAGLFVGTLSLRNRDPQLAEVIGRVEKALAGVESVLEALLDISRLDAGVVAPRLERFPVAAVLRSALETLAEAAARRGITLRFRAGRSWCESDRLLLERIVANLVSNALQHSEGKRILLACRPCGKDLRIEVRDNGRGIAPDRHREIFREFVQLANPGRSHEKGLGLGLAIVERLARLLGHPLYLRSCPGKGSTFGIVVPKVDAVATIEKPSAGETAGGDIFGAHILILDDDEEILAALGTFLSHHGAVPLLARNLEQAEAILRAQGPPHLIISDYRLGAASDGLSAISQLRRQFAPHAPAVVLTGDISPSVLRKVSDAGLALLNKPVRMSSLVQTLSAALHTISSTSPRLDSD
jgi:two-component system, sensor histidine kinase